MLIIFDVLTNLFLFIGTLYLLSISPLYYKVNSKYSSEISEFLIVQFIEFNIIALRITLLTSKWVTSVVEGHIIKTEVIDHDKRQLLSEFNLGTFRRLQARIPSLNLEECLVVNQFLVNTGTYAAHILHQTNPTLKENKSWVLYYKYMNHLLEQLGKRQKYLEFRGHLTEGAITILENYVNVGWLDKNGDNYIYVFEPRKSQARFLALMKYIWQENLINHQSFGNRKEYAGKFFRFVDYHSKADDLYDQFKKSIPTSEHLHVIRNGTLTNSLDT